MSLRVLRGPIDDESAGGFEPLIALFDEVHDRRGVGRVVLVPGPVDHQPGRRSRQRLQDRLQIVIVADADGRVEEPERIPAAAEEVQLGIGRDRQDGIVRA